jgi:hypothetical protein
MVDGPQTIATEPERYILFANFTAGVLLELITLGVEK